MSILCENKIDSHRNFPYQQQKATEHYIMRATTHIKYIPIRQTMIEHGNVMGHNYIGYDS